MLKVVAGGTGLIGRALIEQWLKQHHEIIVIGRSLHKINQMFAQKVVACNWDQLAEPKLQQLLQTAEVIVNLTGANIGAQRWTPVYRKTILNSRIKSTECLAQLCAKWGTASPPLFNASAVGVYGLENTTLHLPETYTEDSAIDWQKFPDFLAEVGRRWEMATQTAQTAGVRVVNLRFGVVLSKLGGALPRLLTPFYYGLGSILGSGQQPFSWVSLTDAVNAIEFIFDHKEIVGPVNIVAPQLITQEQLASSIAKTLHRPCWLRLPAKAIKLIFGDMGSELLLQGQRVYPKYLLEHGFQFTHKNIDSALTDIIAHNV